MVEKFFHFFGDIFFDLVLTHLLHLPTPFACQEEAQDILILSFDYCCIRIFVVIDFLRYEVYPASVVTPEALSKAHIQLIKVSDADFIDELIVFFGERRHELYKMGFEDSEWQA
jgi:hypothetical protein